MSRHGLRAGINDAAARWAQSKMSVPCDVVGEYRWILEPEQRAALPPPKAGPLRINWLLPALGGVSGGLSNIFRTIQNLEKWGHENRIYILDKDTITGSQAQELVRSSYFPIKAPIEKLTEELADSDALLATHWTTAYAAGGVSNTAAKFYFVQDVEHLFYAQGSRSEFAKETYRRGLHGITLGRWIADVLYREFGMPCSPFGFSYDREVYSSNGTAGTREEKKRVLFYARPQTERRGFELGVLALSLVAKQRPDLEFVLAGFRPQGIRVPFRAAFPGVLSPAELAELYRTCSVALVLSYTNLSMLPLELMACECAVVSNRGPNVEWLLTEETTQLADSTPRSVAESLLSLLNNEELRSQKVAAGLAFAKQTTWSSEIKKIEGALYKALGVIQR